LTTVNKVILASKSPRRQELLKALGLTFSLMMPEEDESYPKDVPPELVPEYLSAKKAESIRKQIQPDNVVIAADTIVLLQERIFGKPKDEAEAVKMLHQLSDNMHEVITGVTLLTSMDKITFSVNTQVYFRKLPKKTIEKYVFKYKPLDKAGAYGIQDWIGLVGIEKIDGCYYNVMGLPISRLVIELNALGFNIMP
jgi:septum formation protein